MWKTASACVSLPLSARHFSPTKLAQAKSWEKAAPTEWMNPRIRMNFKWTRGRNCELVFSLLLSRGILKQSGVRSTRCVVHKMCVCACLGYVLTMTRLWHILVLERARKRQRSRRRRATATRRNSKKNETKRTARDWNQFICANKTQSHASSTTSGPLQWHATANLITMGRDSRALHISRNLPIFCRFCSDFCEPLNSQWELVRLLDILVCVRCSLSPSFRHRTACSLNYAILLKVAFALSFGPTRIQCG